MFFAECIILNNVFLDIIKTLKVIIKIITFLGFGSINEQNYKLKFYYK